MQKSLPSSWYTSDDVFARERDGIFFREWLCVAREEDVAEAGDVLVLNVVGESVLLARGRDGSLRAHYNVCRHRGSRLCSSAPGEVGPASKGLTPARTIRCPYHGWTYGLDGALVSAPHLSVDGAFQKEQFGLYPVGVDTWAGFVFLNLTPDGARGLGAQLGAVPERIARYPLAELRRARKIVYEVEANWKVIAENYNECYHCAGVHPELCEVVPAFKQGGGAHLDWDGGIPHREGAFTFTRSGTTSRRPFPGLSDEERVRHKGELVYPNLFLSLSPEHVAAFTLWPNGPRRTRIVCEFLFHPDEMADPAFDPSDAVDFWDLINRQDWVVCEDVQKGISSRVHEFGYYAPMEDMSLDIRRYVTDRLGSD
jgi:Rieske 2Fe-2S family protein